MRNLVLSVLALGLAVPWGAAASEASCSHVGDLPVIDGIEMSDLDDLIEREVQRADGRRVGVVKDIVLDRCGAPSTIVVTVTPEHAAPKDVGIAMDRVRFQPDGDALRIDGLDPPEIAALPPAPDHASMTALRRR